MPRNRNTATELFRLRKQLKVKPLRETVHLEMIHALKVAGGDKEMAADLLGIGKTTIYRQLQQLRRPRQ